MTQAEQTRQHPRLKVIQLETAMGAAIECFKGASAIMIPRSRFAPVKTTNDLFALRSDASAAGRGQYRVSKSVLLTLSSVKKCVIDIIECQKVCY